MLFALMWPTASYYRGFEVKLRFEYQATPEPTDDRDYSYVTYFLVREPQPYPGSST